MRILHFDIDSLRPDHLGAYGYPRPTSPNIDRVAAGGMRFDRCYVSDSPCMPSRAAYITGRFGLHNGIVTHGPAFNTPNLPQQLYGGPTKDYQLLPIRLRQGGVDSFCFSTFPVRHMATWYGLGWSGMHTPSLENGTEKAEEVSAGVLDWLRKNAGRDDYYLHVNFWDPHRIYKESLRGWADRFEGVPHADSWPDDAAVAGHGEMAGPFTALNQGEWTKQTNLQAHELRDRADVEHTIDGYDAMIAYTDHHVGLILDELERQGVLDNTAVVVTADHGDAFGENGVYTDHVCAHEPVHRVPLIVKWPGVAAAGTSSDELVYQLDWTATLCDLAGGGVPAGYDGTSLAGHLHGGPGPGPGRDALYFGHGLYTLQRAVRTRDHLLLRTYHPHEYNQFRETMLYDVAADPHLTRDLADERPDLAAKLSADLDAWLAAEQAKPHAIGDPLLRVRDARLGRSP